MDDPEKYPLIGPSSYLGKVKNYLIYQEFILSQFSGNVFIAQTEYRQSVLRELNEGHEEKYDGVKDQRSLGEDRFIEQIEGHKREILGLQSMTFQ